MLGFAFMGAVLSLVVLKVVDWFGGEGATKHRTKLFGLFVVMVLATIGLFGLEVVVPIMFGPRM